MYDVYYTTGGGPWINAGTDMWVNLWMEEILPHLDVKPILLIHRNKPNTHTEYEFPLETHWVDEGIGVFEKICENARRINILHGHYTPMNVLVENKDKIHSNVMHNSVDHTLKSSIGSDTPFAWHSYMSSDWEQQITDWSKYNIWIGLFDIKHKNINIPNFYEFKHNKELSHSNGLGFGARCEGRKNPHYLDKIPSFIFTNSSEFNLMWKHGAKVDISKSRMYHFNPLFKDKFYNMDWGISHSTFTNEPFGYSIFENVDYGKLPIIHKNWCKDLDYKYRASTKKEFGDIYKQVQTDSYEEKQKWFNIIKTYMIDNFTDKELWKHSFVNIYNK